MWTRKTAKEVIPPSSPIVTNSLLFAKSPLKSLIMLSRLPISSTTPSPTLSHPRQSEMHSRRTTSALLSRKKSTLLKKGHQLAHLRFAQYHENWTVEDWKRVLWSYETKINRIGSDGRVYTWKQKGEPLSDRTSTPTVKHGGGNNLMA